MRTQKIPGYGTLSLALLLSCQPADTSSKDATAATDASAVDTTQLDSVYPDIRLDAGHLDTGPAENTATADRDLTPDTRPTDRGLHPDARSPADLVVSDSIPPTDSTVLDAHRTDAILDAGSAADHNADSAMGMADSWVADARAADAGVADTGLNDSGTPFTVEEIGRLTYQAGSQSWPMVLLRLSNAAGGYTYAQWIPPLGNQPKPTMVLCEPYTGIDWSGEEVDTRWANLPGATLPAAHPDVDGPDYQGVGDVIYQLMSPQQKAEEFTIHLLNGFGLLVVYGRFYAGGNLENDIQDVVSGLTFLTTQPLVDKQRIAVAGGSWGGFEALYGTANAPEGAVPKNAVALYPPSDFASFVTYLTQGLAASISDPTTLSEYTLFFDAYRRRIVSAAGGLPGAPGADYSAYSHQFLQQNLRSPVLIVHDQWDTLVPPAQSLELSQIAPSQVEVMWYNRPDPIDFAIHPRGHGPLLDEPDYPTLYTFSLAYNSLGIALPQQEVQVIYSPRALQDFVARVRAQQLNGMATPWFEPRLEELRHPNVQLYDFTPGQEPTLHQGSAIVQQVLSRVYGGARSSVDAGSCAPWSSSDIPVDAGMSPCSTGAPSETGDPYAVETTASGVVIHHNLTYAVRGGLALQGDLFLPVNTNSDLGVLVMVHGGGWVDCQRRRGEVAWYAHWLATERDIPIFNIEYRLVQEGGAFAGNLKDVKCAVQWIASQAATYGFDDSRVAIIGESAGAHLATLVGLTADRQDLDPQCSAVAPQVNTVFAFSGPMDMPLFYDNSEPGLQSVVESYAGSCEPVEQLLSERPCNRCLDSSPLAHAAGSQPRVVVVQATDDFDYLVPLVQGQLAHHTLAYAGAQTELLIPTRQEMEDWGCQQNEPATAAHGFSLCLLGPTLPRIDALMKAAVGR